MRRLAVFLFAFIISALLLMSGCKKNNSVEIAGTGFDERLIGAWYLWENNPNLQLEAPQILSGIQIRDSKECVPLGLENATGKLKALPFTLISKIHKADFNILVLEVPYADGGSYIDTGAYQLYGDTLLWKTKYVTKTYLRGTINSVLREPFECNASATIDGYPIRNDSVSAQPSSYVELNEINHSLKFHMKSMNIVIEIEIDSSNGPGVYLIKGGNAKYSESDPCSIGPVYWADSTTSGRIEISSMSMSTNLCTGNFTFSAVHRLNNGLIQKKRIDAGWFSVPLYRNHPR